MRSARGAVRRQTLRPLHPVHPVGARHPDENPNTIGRLAAAHAPSHGIRARRQATAVFPAPFIEGLLAVDRFRPDLFDT